MKIQYNKQDKDTKINMSSNNNSNSKLQEHNIAPIYNIDSKILILGSFPSVKSRENQFFYMHPQNRFWPLMGRLLNCDIPSDTDRKIKLLLDSNIALFDVIKSCKIEGSSDSTISDVVVNDIASIVKNTNIRSIYCNGSTAMSLYKKYVIPTLPESFNIMPIMLPSTSPANAAFSLDCLEKIWQRILIPLTRNYDKAYYSMNEYANDFFGKKLYKLSINAGFTCPNRDGKIDTRGCIFCDGGGAGDFAGNRQNSIKEQLAEQKQLIAGKLSKSKTNGYIAYFQAFTNTYANAEKLLNIYNEAANDPDIDIISIATRPDCLDKDVLDVLSEITKKKTVWIELGLQTKHNSTAKYIRRGYDLKVYEKAVRNLQLIGIDHIITHVILGLPGENEKMILDTVSYVCRSGVNGIKLQLLHVLKNTDLAIDYKNGKFDVFTEDEYIDILKKCLSILPCDMVTHRLTGDGNKNTLIAPLWSTNKKHVLNRINNLVIKT